MSDSNPLLALSPSSPTRRPGGQPGNSNAVKHGYYSRFFHRSERSALAREALPEGLLDEITFLRVLLHRVAEKCGEANTLRDQLYLLRIVSLASTSLAHLLRAQRWLVGDGTSDVKEAISAALADVLQEIRDSDELNTPPPDLPSSGE